MSNEAFGSAETSDGCSPARVLLAEDDFELRELLVWVLRQDGHEVVEAHDGNELWQKLKAEASGPESGRFKLVITDLCMPGLSAFDVLAELQREVSHLPLILITAFGDQTTHLRALRLGASRVIDKPFDFDVLRQAVHELLHREARRAS